MLKRGILKVMRRYGYTALRIEALERERDENARAHQDLIALRGELNGVRATSQAIVLERDEIAANLARQNQEIDTVIAQRDNSEAQQSTLAAQLSQSQSQVVLAQQSTAAQIRDLKDKAEKQLELEQRSKAALSEKIEILGKKIVAQQEELNARADVRAELEALRGEIVSLNERLKVAQYSKRRDRMESKQLKDELEEVRAEFIAKSIRLEQAQTELVTAERREEELKEALKLQKNQAGGSDQSLLEQRFLQLVAEHEITLTELAETYDQLEGEQAGWRSRSWDGNITPAQDQQQSEQMFPKNIVIAGLPYSRAGELADTIRSAGLHQDVTCCGMLFPNDILTAGAFAGDEKYIANTFLDASPRNLESLREAMATTIVHLTDPRQLVVRRAFSVISKSGESLAIEPGISPALADRDTLSMEVLVDLQAAYFVPHIAAWIEGWLVYIDGRPNWPIFLTTDEMLDDESFNSEMVKDLGLSDESVVNQVVDADGVSWREVLTSEQSDTILAAVPAHIRERFNWL